MLLSSETDDGEVIESIRTNIPGAIPQCVSEVRICEPEPNEEQSFRGHCPDKVLEKRIVVIKGGVAVLSKCHPADGVVIFPMKVHHLPHATGVIHVTEETGQGLLLGGRNRLTRFSDRRVHGFIRRVEV
jgi:hypothetical protein